MIKTLRGKQKNQVTNVGLEKIKLSCLLVQHINEFKVSARVKKGEFSKFLISRRSDKAF